MESFKCKICGGKLNIIIGSDTAVCDSCGSFENIGPDDVKKYSDIYKSAQRTMRQNNISAYSDAINQLQGISFIDEAKDLSDICEKRIEEIRAKQKIQEQKKEESDRQNTKTGIILIVLTVLVLLLAAAGAVYIVIHFYRGDLSPRAVAVIISAVIIFALAAVVGKLKG